MLYHLLVPFSSDFVVFNVFRYITFRSVWALLTALILSILIGPRFINWLRRLKFGQYILEDVATHKAKAGTPTMGGLLIAFSLLGSVFLWADLSNVYIWLTLFVFVGFGLVGFLDDWIKIKRKSNKGLRPLQKLLGQLVVGGLAVYLLLLLPAYSSKLIFPFFKDIAPNLGWFYIPFALLVMVGTSNGVNLTDGLDGLAIGPTIVAGGCLAVFVYIAGNAGMANYLQVAQVPGVGEVSVFCGALVGAGMGFLWFNAFPAELFMGDVGSLSLGGVLGFIAVLCKQELILPVLGGIFVMETLSVILQVAFFRWTGGKRILRMAPFHHHFELKGVPESKIVIRIWLSAVIFGMISLSVLKLR
jgi:phospho-N-acetylmuramoyl-pentapeptide-transferase